MRSKTLTIQVTSILERIAAETTQAIERLFPDQIDEPVCLDEPALPLTGAGPGTAVLGAPKKPAIW